MSGDRNTDNTNTPSPEQRAINESWSKVSSDLSAPGSKIDRSNSDLSTLNSNLQNNIHLPLIEITEMQANPNDSAGRHTDSVQLTDWSNGTDHHASNGTYNVDTHQLTYQRDQTLPGSNGQETVTIDMLTGKETITAAGDGDTTRTTTIPPDGQKATTVVSEGQTAPGQPIGRISSSEITDYSSVTADNRTLTDYTYTDGKLTSFSNSRTGEVHLPPDAKDAKVDPTTGAVDYTRPDGVKVAIGVDGKSNTMTTPPNQEGQVTTVTSTQGDVKVTTTDANGNVVRSFDHDDVNPGSVKVSPDGTVSMDRVPQPGLGSDKTLGTVTVAPNGQETTVIKGAGPNGNGDITIVRPSAGADPTTFSINDNGKQVKLVDDKGKPFPGLNPDDISAGKTSPDIKVDDSGKVTSYKTLAGVEVKLASDGQTPIEYDSKDFKFVFNKDKNEWDYNQNGSSTYVHIDVPTVNADGTISSKENGGWNDGREHKLDSQGERTGENQIASSFINATVAAPFEGIDAAFGTNTAQYAHDFGTNALHSLIDSNVNAIEQWTGVPSEYKINMFQPVDKDAPGGDVAAAAAGSIVGSFLPIGRIAKGLGVIDDWAEGADKEAQFATAQNGVNSYMSDNNNNKEWAEPEWRKLYDKWLT